MATKTLLTLDQFMALPEREEDGTHYELSEGELIKLSRRGLRHGLILSEIIRLLLAALPAEYVAAAGDVGCLLDPNPEAATVRGPDIAVVRRSAIDKPGPAGWIEGGPVIAIEIVSPSDTAHDLHLKVKQYLRAGSLEVWLVYPDTQTLYVYSAGQRAPQVYEEGDEFTSVVGVTFRASDLFRF